MSRSIYVLIVFLILSTSHTLYAQDAATPIVATEHLEKLRAQLRDVKAKEATLQERVRQLDVELQPDNLQRAVSRIPSLNPGELRDERQRQLEGEKTKAQEQLTSLADSRVTLEGTINDAERELTRLKEPNNPKSAATSSASAQSQESAPAATTSEDYVQQPPNTRKSKSRTARKRTSLSTHRYTTEKQRNN